MAARCCQDALRASKTKEEVYHVLRLMVRLSDDIGKLQLIEFCVIITQYGYFKYPETTRQIVYLILFDALKINAIQLF